MRPSDAVKHHALSVLDAWVQPEEAPAVVAGFREHEALIRALSAAGVDPLNDEPRAIFLQMMLLELRHGRAEAEVLFALQRAADALGDALDAAAVAQDRLRRLAELVSMETKGGAE